MSARTESPSTARSPASATASADSRAFDLLKELVSLTSERWASPTRFAGLARQWAPGGVPAQIRFLTQVKAIVRSLPPQVFVDMDARLAVLGALQEALDQAIEQEEQEGR